MILDNIESLLFLKYQEDKILFITLGKLIDREFFNLKNYKRKSKSLSRFTKFFKRNSRLRVLVLSGI